MDSPSRPISSKRATIADVAAQAGVSKATVSHVVNDTRTVEADTRARVLLAIEELGYRPSSVARSLKTNRTQSVGFIVSDVTNSFFGDVLRGIDDILRPANCSSVVCSTDEILEREDHYLNLLLHQRVDGIIAAATSREWAALRQADLLHTPIVLVDRAFEGWSGPFVGVDNQAAARLGTNHLIECGHRRIGIVAGFQRLSTMRERLAGFRQSLEEHGLQLPEEWVVPSPLSIEAGIASAIKILSLPEPPSALFISNNLLTLGALLAVKNLGLRCPEDVALIGFDDHQWAAVARPPLTVIRQPSRRIGQIAAEMLLSLIRGQEVPQQRMLLECELEERESCRSPRPPR